MNTKSTQSENSLVNLVRENCKTGQCGRINCRSRLSRKKGVGEEIRRLLETRRQNC